MPTILLPTTYISVTLLLSLALPITETFATSTLGISPSSISLLTLVKFIESYELDGGELGVQLSYLGQQFGRDYPSSNFLKYKNRLKSAFILLKYPSNHS